MRILHFADVHLDRPVVGLRSEAAEERRRELWRGFRRSLDLAREQEVDLVTIGGDLWEDENVRPDTRASVAHELGQLGVPALLICGNHDPYLPGGHYARTAWPDNVHVFAEPEASEYRLGDLSVWGVSWSGGSLTADFLERTRGPADGRHHLLMLHGTATGDTHFADRHAHCPFDPQLVLNRGFAHCLAGHIHAAAERPGVLYPGSPEPLGWGETGRHCCALVEVGNDGAVSTRLVDVNERRYLRRTVDCAGASSSAAVGERIETALSVDDDPASLYLRLELHGEVERDCEIRPEELVTAHAQRYAGLVVHDHTEPAYDFEALAGERTARGRFVADIGRRLQATDDERERGILESGRLAGLRALAGRKDVA